MARLRQAERNTRRRKRVMFIGGAALLLYVALLIVQLTLPHEKDQHRYIGIVSSSSQQPKEHNIPIPGVPSYKGSRINPDPNTTLSSVSTPSLIGGLTIHETSKAKIQFISPGIGMPSFSTYHLITTRAPVNTHFTVTLMPVRPFSAQTSLAQAFSTATRQSSVRRAAIRRSGFEDDPDPTTPADPLNNDPFAGDPDPSTPADPLANTPIGDGAMILVIMALAYAYKNDKMVNG